MTHKQWRKKEQILNGVNVDEVRGTVNAIDGESELAKSKFRVRNKWLDGGHNQTTIDGFYAAGQENSHSAQFILDADEPPLLAGEDRGANPVEHLLNALAACMTATMVYHAAFRGIKLDGVESELEGILIFAVFWGSPMR